MALGETYPGMPGSEPARAPTGEVDPQAGGERMSRRRFIRVVLGFSFTSFAAMVITPIVAFLVPTKRESETAGARVLVGTTADIPPGSGKVVAMGSSPVIVINAANEVRAFSAVCTHLGCIVNYDQTAQAIICPCHDGRFNPASGAVISGPPPAPLKPITVNLEQDQIFLVRG